MKTAAAALRHRAHPLWLAHALHRISGLLLALFLPAHFWMLSRALNSDGSFERAIAWTDSAFFKIAEWGLVFLLAVHMLGGLRLLALEFLPWSGPRKWLAAAAVAGAFAVSVGFLLTAVSA